MALPIIHPPAELLVETAKLLEISNQKTKTTTKWKPTEQQIRFWDHLEKNQATYALKARQVFFTTAMELFDLLFTVVNTERGNKIETWLIWDTDDKVREKVGDIADFARQLDIPHRHIEGDARIVFDRFDARGERLKPSVIRGFTSGGKRTGASLTANLVHLSETPYWADPMRTFQSLAPTIGAGGVVGMETTMAASSKLCRQLWDTPNIWSKMFVSVQDHKNYQLPPDDCRPPNERKRKPEEKIPLPEDVEEKLRTEGFTNRRTMAFVYYQYFNFMGKDWLETLREYPQLPRHCFNLASGRWIRLRPRVLPYRSHYCGSRTGYRQNFLKVFKEPHEGSGQYVIACDTAGKKGRTRSAVVVIDKKDGAMMACWVSDEGDHRDIVEALKEAQKFYTRDHDLPIGLRNQLVQTIPPGVIEMNGPGGGTATIARDEGVYVVEYDANEQDNAYGLQILREKAESRILEGPEELVEEADSLRQVQRNEDAPRQWKGLKDLCMACSAAYVYIRSHPYEEELEPEEDRSEFFDLAKRANW